MKVLVTGAIGQLAHDIRDTWSGHQIVALPRVAMDIDYPEQIEGAVAELRPDCIVNTAAFHRVDECEDRYAEAFRTNVLAVASLARAAQRQGAILVQFSTDYVFNGAQRRPYLEDDPAYPLSAYGQSRLAGEWMARHYCERSYVVRTCGLYGIGGAANFVETMLRLACAGQPLRVVDDQMVTPTSTRELARKLAELVPAAPFGLYHMTNTGECSWYEFAGEIFRLFGVSADLSPVSSAVYGARARRPAYSVLDNARLREAGIADFSPWHEALAEYARRRGERRGTGE